MVGSLAGHERGRRRAGIVNDVTAYTYSSACADSPLKMCEL
jgi:hypothetical protein